jgi:hypothetical protein
MARVESYTREKILALLESVPVGPKGDKGDTGTTGLTGATGPKGLKGDSGVTGTTGAKGDKGDPGVAGPQGEVGPAGPKGDKGDASDVAGPQGEVGPTGPKGDPGEKGDTGDKGDSGDIGYPARDTPSFDYHTPDGEATLDLSCRIIAVEASAATRWRLYRSAAQRGADLSRPFTTTPVGDAVLADLKFLAAGTIWTNPVIDVSRTGEKYYTRIDGAADITITKERTA